MKDIVLHSDALTVHANAFGAELRGVEKDGLEYLWQGDTDIYPRTSPTLFPVIGRFVSDTYYVGDRDYKLPLNGFAMNRNFTVAEQTENSAVFELTDSAATREMYPFSFLLRVTYTAEKNTVFVRQHLENRGENEMPWCLGCHTAYRWPRFENEQSTDYYLRFEKKESLHSFNPFGWEEAFVIGTDEKPLHHGLFANYTRSLKNIESEWIELRSRKSDRAVRIHRAEYPYLAIWTMPTEDAKLICLEPCTSVHPANAPSLHLSDRWGARVLAPGETADLGFSVDFI